MLDNEVTDKIVEFNKYCKTCMYKDLSEGDEPCNTCLGETTNLYSHKPVKYKENEELVAELKKQEEQNNKEKEKEE